LSDKWKEIHSSKPKVKKRNEKRDRKDLQINSKYILINTFYHSPNKMKTRNIFMKIILFVEMSFVKCLPVRGHTNIKMERKNKLIPNF
jgi:hypothetical protein